MAAQQENDEAILEGFLCPICMSDFPSAKQLTTHFESSHQEEKDLLRSLKEVYGKAKKILNLDESDLKDTFDRTLHFNNSELCCNEHVQELGVTRNYTDYFKSVRLSRLERYAVETNKLLIRLDKLVSNMPTDSSQRKQYEQDVVPWLDGSLVKLCPSCAKSFNLTRRQHHCRLCGSLLCHDCSVFLNLNVAKRIVDPSASDVSQSSENEQEGLRMCEHCYNLIELRKQVQDSRNAKTVLATGYQQMRSLMEEAKPLVAKYDKMCQSLYDGETVYNLCDVNATRGSLGKLAEGIDVLSRQIAALPVTQPGNKQHKLQNYVRQAAVNYIKENLLTLRRLPTEDQLAKLTKERYERAERKIEAERRRLQTHAEMLRKENKATTSRSITNNESSTDNDDNPLLEQMSIIRGYIKNARETQPENVPILEANLKELKKEYQLQRLGKNS